MRRPALQNDRIGDLGTAFRARKVFGTIEKRALGPTWPNEKRVQFPQKLWCCVAEELGTKMRYIKRIELRNAVQF